MIKKIQIKKLFGRFDYHIELMPNGVTIITGPNGFGKSTILKIINALSNGKVGYFINLDFDEITAIFDDSKAVIKKNKAELNYDGIAIPLSDNEYSDCIRYLSRAPWIRRTPNGYYDMRLETYLTESECLNLILSDESIYDSFPQKNGKNIEKLKLKAKELKNLCGEVRLISDQRLIKEEAKRADERRIIDTISELPNRLKEEISRVSSEYSSVANTLDSSYPKRLFAAKVGIEDQNEYSALLKEANEKFEKLSKYNLVDISIIDEKEYNLQYSTALKIYFDDFTEKYKVFEDLIDKFDLFTSIINDRLVFKRITITRNDGFVVEDTEIPGKILKLSQLSSGEKQEILLFYDLIFNSKNNLLLLIDEPEISLHIAWQKKFLDDLIDVASRNNVQAIVATHSPQVISTHLDIQIDLGEIYGNRLNKEKSNKRG